MTMLRRAAILLVAPLAIGLAGCGSSGTSSASTSAGTAGASASASASSAGEAGASSSSSAATGEGIRCLRFIADRRRECADVLWQGHGHGDCGQHQHDLAGAECGGDANGFAVNAGTIVLDPSDTAVRGKTQYIGIAITSAGSAPPDGSYTGIATGNDNGARFSTRNDETTIVLTQGGKAGTFTGTTLTGDSVSGSFTQLITASASTRAVWPPNRS